MRRNIEWQEAGRDGGRRTLDRATHFQGRLNGQPTEGDAPTFPYIFEEVGGFELFDSFAFDVLLGMDILRQCELLISRGDRCSLTFGG
jgi:hypothetical protein